MKWLRDNVAPWASVFVAIGVPIILRLAHQIKQVVNGRLDEALKRIAELERTIRENGYARSSDPPGYNKPATRRRRQND